MKFDHIPLPAAGLRRLRLSPRHHSQSSLQVMSGGIEEDLGRLHGHPDVLSWSEPQHFHRHHRHLGNDGRRGGDADTSDGPDHVDLVDRSMPNVSGRALRLDLEECHSARVYDGEDIPCKSLRNDELTTTVQRDTGTLALAAEQVDAGQIRHPWGTWTGRHLGRSSALY